MELPQVLIKNNYYDYLNGNEVEATVVLPENGRIQPGEHVLAYRDSLATLYDVPVPKEMQSRYIGIEGRVTQLGFRGTDKPQNGARVQLLKVKKV